MDAKANVLVTGSTGFIGRHLTGALDGAGYKVYPFARSLGNDIRERGSLDNFIDKNIGVVFHLAGSTFVPDSWSNAEAFYKTNILGTQNILDFSKMTGAKLVYVSTYVYGKPGYLPIDERHPAAPNNPYAHSKWLGEELCRFYSREMGLKVVILRPFNIYGPGQREEFLIPSILRQIKEGVNVEVKDDLPRRDYLHVADFVEACLLSMNRNGIFDIFNVGSGASISVRDIITTMIRLSGKDISWASAGEKREGEIPETVADCGHIREALGWKPRVSFDDGVKEMLR